MKHRRALNWILAALCWLSNGAAAQLITEFATGITPGSFPFYITTGPDGNLWFTEGAYRIARITPAGVVTEFSDGITIGTVSIAAGPDGNLWFTEFGDRIGRITPTGTVTYFSEGITAGARPNRITAGPDGNLWFTEWGISRIGRITPTGEVTEFSAGITGTNLAGITAAADGNLWFGEAGLNKIGRITTTGEVTEFGQLLSSPGVNDIAVGPDGNLWFTEAAQLPFSPPIGIGQITPTGTITEFSGLISGGDSGNTAAPGITAGPDGNLWFTESGLSRIGRITPSGTVTEFSISANSRPTGITLGPDGDLWFTETNISRIGRITTGGGGPQTADLAISKAGSPNPVIVGNSLTYTITVINNGPDPATGVTAADTLPSGVTLVSSTASQGFGCSGTNIVTCSLGSLSSGASAMVTIVVTPPQPGGISNTATVTSNETDPELANNTAVPVVTTIIPPPQTLNAFSPAEIWLGRAGDTRLKFDVLAEVLINGSVVGSGQLSNVSAGGSTFSKASLDTVPLVLGALTAIPAGASFGIRVSVRASCSVTSANNFGIARLWYNGQPIDRGRSKDAGSRFGATIAAKRGNYYLSSAFGLAVVPGSSRQSIDVAVSNSMPCPARPFTPLGMWSTTLP